MVPSSPPPTEPTSIAAPETIAAAGEDPVQLAVVAGAPSASTSQASTAPE